jgi:hypothetical protein
MLGNSLPKLYRTQIKIEQNVYEKANMNKKPNSEHAII